MHFKTTPLLSAILLATSIGSASAATCETVVESNDAMKYNVSEITVDKSCKNFKVTLKHVGKMPKTAMGHNWVLTKTADQAAVNAEGIKAGAGKNYLPADDARIIAATKLIGGGETAEVNFATAKLKAGDDYTFFCSFPGHSGLMKGKLKF